MSNFSSPVKSQSFSISSLSISPKKFSDSEIKSLEVEAISLLDSDIRQSKQLLETCLRKYNEEEFPILENMYLLT